MTRPRGRPVPAPTRLGAGRVLVSHRGAPWLPGGGRADVVVAEPGSAAPAPIGIVRLLLVHDDRILCVQREDGRGWDIPSEPVVSGRATDAWDTLLVTVVGEVRRPTLVGWVHNVVHAASGDYPWPVPDAFFAVYTCDVEVGQPTTGTWLDADEVEEHLSTRHWWPLAAHVRAGPGGDTRHLLTPG